MYTYMVDMLSNSDAHIKDKGYREESDGHYRYNLIDQVTPDDAMRKTENSGFLKKYAATIDSDTRAPAPGADVNLNKPPQRRQRTFMSYSTMVQKESSTKRTHQSQNMDATMAASAVQAKRGHNSKELLTLKGN
jgi:hypothetical protein